VEAIFSDTSYGGLLEEDVSSKGKMSWGTVEGLYEKRKGGQQKPVQFVAVVSVLPMMTSTIEEHQLSPSMVAILMKPLLLAGCRASRASLSKV